MTAEGDSPTHAGGLLLWLRTNSGRVIVSQGMVWAVQGEYGHAGHRILLLLSIPGYDFHLGLWPIVCVLFRRANGGQECAA